MTLQTDRQAAYDDLVRRVEHAEWQPLVREIANARLRINVLRDSQRALEVDPLDKLRVEVLAVMPANYRAAVEALTQCLAWKKQVLEWKP